MSWLQEKWFKKLILFFIFLIIFIISLSLFATIYINKILTIDKIQELTQKYSQQYFNRSIEFKSYKFNVLKGVILNNIVIGKNADIKNSAVLNIEEINLRYDYKKLLKLKIYVDKIVVKGLDFYIKKEVIRDEIEYYKERFKSSLNTNKEITKKKGDKSINIKFIQLINSKIGYFQAGKKINIIVNNIEVKNEKKINIYSDLTVQYKKIRIKIKGVLDYAEDINLSWKIIIDRLSGKIDLYTANFKDYKLKSNLRYDNKDFTITSLLEYDKNKIKIISLFFSDDINRFTVKQGTLDLKTQKFAFLLLSKMNNVNNHYIKDFKKINKSQFNFNLDLKLFVLLYLNDFKNIIVNGDIVFKNSEIHYNQNSFFLKRADFVIKDNKVQINNGIVKYKDQNFNFDLYNSNIFKKYKLYNIKVRSSEIDLKNLLIKKNPLFNNKLYNLRCNAILNIERKNITFLEINFKFLKGDIISDGNIDFSGNDIKFMFTQNAENISSVRLMDIYNIKNISGPISGEAFLSARYTKDKKIKFEKLKGELISQFNYNKLKDININISYKLRKNKIYYYNSYLTFDYNRFNFWGFYNLDTKFFKLNAGDNRIFFSSIKVLENKYKGDLFFDFFLEKKNNKKPVSTLKIKSGSMTYQRMLFNNIKADFTINSNVYSGNINVDSFYNGTIISELKGDFNNNKLKIISIGKKIKLASLSKDYLNMDVSGKLDFKVDMTFLKESREGTIDIKAVKGEIIDTPFQIKLYHALKELLPIRDILYTSADIKIALKNNLLNFKKLVVICPDQEHRVTGAYNYKTKYRDLIINVKVHEEFIKDVPNLITSFISEEKNNWYYIKPYYQKGSLGNLKEGFK